MKTGNRVGIVDVKIAYDTMWTRYSSIVYLGD